jgi:hypothetical protein
MLTTGAAIGGFATAALGTDAAFILDSATYLLSAFLFLGLNLPPRPPREKQKLTVLRATGIEDVFEGLKYVWRRPRVLAVMLAKPAQCIAGGTLTLLAIYGEKVFPIAGSGEIGIGVLYAVRGIGTAFAPIVVQRFVRGSRRSSARRFSLSVLFLRSSVRPKIIRSQFVCCSPLTRAEA